MGNTCKPMAVSFQCMTKFTTKKKFYKQTNKQKNPNRDVIRAEGRINSGQGKTEVFSKWVVVTYKSFVSHVKEFRIWGKQLSY